MTSSSKHQFENYSKQLLKLKNISKSEQSTQTDLPIEEVTVVKTESAKVKGSPAKPILENRLRPVEISLDQSELRTTQKSDQSEEDESDQSDTEVSKILNSTENENKPDENPSEHFNVEFDQRPCSANYLYAESILSDVPNCSTEYWRTFMDQSSLRGSVFPASIAGSELDLRLVFKSLLPLSTGNHQLIRIIFETVFKGGVS